MLTKIIYVIVDCFAIISLIFTVRALTRLGSQACLCLKKAMISAIVAIIANICVALSFNRLSAEIAYCAYFATIDWILFYLGGFCVLYTEHEHSYHNLKIPFGFAMGVDSLSILLNPFFHHSFYIYETTDKTGSIFYQTGFYPAYYMHLAVDYIILLVAVSYIIYRIATMYGFYRTKYVIIISVLAFIVILNIAYMALKMVLDASVVFYAVGGVLIYISINVFVPRSLMISSIGRAVDGMTEGLILLDIANNYIYSNSFVKEHFGIDAETFNINKEPVATVMRALEDDGSSIGETVYIKHSEDGNQKKDRHYRIKYNEIQEKKNRIIGSYFLIEDTTEEVFFLNEIRQAQIAADKANEAKSTFLANMSHEIRTPLNSVLGLNEMILRSTTDPKLREYAEGIKTSSDILLSLINDVLDFSKIEARKMDVAIAPYNPHDLLRECYFCFEQMAQKKDLYIKIECEESMPSMLSGDYKLINQVLSNIVSNAIKYTSEGGVTIKMSFKDALIISVKDTGMGIKEDDIPLLFDAFKRVNEKQNASIQGTGLGLAITKELVDLMKGTIDIESELGKGSVFSVHLPQVVKDSRAIGPFSKQSSKSSEIYHESFKAPEAKILLVDDVPMNLMVVEGLLRPTEVKVDKASGGDEAIELCKSVRYDLILLDHRMPDKDGVETFNIIKEEGQNTNTPVIMLTANALNGVEEEYKNIGFADYLSKPTKPADLEAALVKHLPSEKVIKM
ncbi:MAG: response regulator [Lachnospiraceae bacterium]|nr:response regulator [Lachnospiraceae bacterium]